jgi:hypothetical protein
MKYMQIEGKGAWFGPLQTFYTDSLRIKGVRSTGVDATNNRSVQ